MANPNSRAQRVQNLLKIRMHPMTVREICRDLGLPDEEAKFVSSILVGCVKKGRVAAFPHHLCSIANRKHNAYMWADPATSAHATGAGSPGPRARRPRAQRAGSQRPSAAPPPRQPLTPDQARRADARRAAAQAAAEARRRQQEVQMNADRRVRAFLIFERHTGCRSRDPADMKAAYRRASLKHHPDRGGNPQVMAELNSAWSEIGG